MLTYTAADLKALNFEHPPSRPVRKSLFTCRLWRPARDRRRTGAAGWSGSGRGNVPPRLTGVTQPSRRSADRCMVVGWLNVQSLRRKTDIVQQTITERSLDVLALTETWHNGHDDVCLRLSTPAGYAVVDVARTSGRGGGVAVIYRRHLKCSPVPLPPCRTMEVICVRLITTSGPVVVMNVYRPPVSSERPSSLFFDELTTLFELLVVYSCPVVVGGDFNIAAQDVTDADSCRLSSILSSFDMVQHVDRPTHRCGNMLDLVMTPADRPLSAVTVQPPGLIADHSLVISQLPVKIDLTSPSERLVRSWRCVDRDELRRLLEVSPLCAPVPADVDVDELFDTYNSVLLHIADQLAPHRVIRRRPGRPTPWFDAECRVQRRHCRRLERRYRRTNRADDRRSWVDATRRRFALYRTKKEQYWTNRLQQCARSPPQLWRSMNSLFDRRRDVSGSTSHTAEGFVVFFKKKIHDIRAATADTQPPPTCSQSPASLTEFMSCTEDEVRRIIKRSPIKSCTLDPVPTFLLHEFIDLLLPYVTSMVNASLKQGRFPVSQRHAIITPRLKKPGLDAADMANYRPVSNVSFVSKLVERVVAVRLHHYLNSNDLLPSCQSAYRKHHSVETAMLHVWSDIMTATDQRQVTLLALLDMSSAFDCVDHELLLHRLRITFGITGTALSWISSFLCDRTYQLAYGGELSTTHRLQFGVPQGSVLGPLLYILYTVDICRVVESHNLRLHLYADDCQIYTSVAVGDVTSAVQNLAVCISDINTWTSASRLRFNSSKTEIMWLGAGHLLQQVDIGEIPVLSSMVKVVQSARDLGVILDSQLSLCDHIAASCRAGFYQLRQIRPAIQSLTPDAAKTIVQAFIACRLDWCNSLLYGVPEVLLRKLQSVQNAAARLLTGTRRCDHITPVLRRLHWLPVQRRVKFKIACLVHQSLASTAPMYLSADIHLASEHGRQLRSSLYRSLAVPRTRTTFGDRSFTVAGPRLWNSLPATLRQITNYGQFKRHLKSYLFRA